MRFVVEGEGEAEAAPGRTMLDVCEGAGLRMDSACGGFAACNSCRVSVVSGADRLSPVRPEELAFLDGPGERLGCQATFLEGSGEVRVRPCPGA